MIFLSLWSCKNSLKVCDWLNLCCPGSCFGINLTDSSDIWEFLWFSVQRKSETCGNGAGISSNADLSSPRTALSIFFPQVRHLQFHSPDCCIRKHSRHHCMIHYSITISFFNRLKNPNWSFSLRNEVANLALGGGLHRHFSEEMFRGQEFLTNSLRIDSPPYF